MGGFFGSLVGLITTIIVTTTPAPDPAMLKLDQFLQDKKSPLPAVELFQYPNWPVIVALSSAESGYGQYLAGDFNAWGIKDFRAGSKNFGGTRDFASWEESIQFTSKLLYRYDTEDGMPRPHEMVVRWKAVAPYKHWVNNVSHSLRDIEAKVLS